MLCDDDVTSMIIDDAHAQGVSERSELTPCKLIILQSAYTLTYKHTE